MAESDHDNERMWRRDPLVLPLEEAFEYNPETGKLHWRWRSLAWFRSRREWRQWNDKHADQEAGGTARRVLIHQRQSLVSHVVIALHTGRWPRGRVRHANGDLDDTRIENLRWRVVERGPYIGLV